MDSTLGYFCCTWPCMLLNPSTTILAIPCEETLLVVWSGTVIKWYCWWYYCHKELLIFYDTSEKVWRFTEGLMRTTARHPLGRLPNKGEGRMGRKTLFKIQATWASSLVRLQHMGEGGDVVVCSRLDWNNCSFFTNHVYSMYIVYSILNSCKDMSKVSQLH